MCDDIFDFNGNGETDIGDLYLEMEIVNGDDESNEDETDYSDDDDNDDEDEDEDEDEIEDSEIESYDDYSDNRLDDKNCDYDKNENSNYGETNIYTDTITIPMAISFGHSNVDETVKTNQTDYPNKRQYRAAYALANELSFCCVDDDDKRRKSCCEFILNKADKILAANYLTYDRGFLYSQAVKDNFKLPVTLPDEDEKSEFELIHILQKIEKRNIPLAIEVWVWCLEQFLPYAQYTASSKSDMTNWILLCLCGFSDEFKISLVRYMGEHPNFRKMVTGCAEDATDGIIELVGIALKKSLFDTAKDLFKDGLAIANGKWKPINELIEAAISYSKTYEELETIEYVEQEFLPIVKSYRDGMIQDEIPLWEKDIAEYKLEMEQECEKYAYTRRNSWRMTVPDGKKYGLDPVNYDTEKEYLDALNEEKYGWRSWYENRDTCRLNTEDYETVDEFSKDLSLKIAERQKEEFEKRQKEREEKRKKANVPAIEDDANIYIYCGVCFPFTSYPYYFRINDTSIKIGDTVVVPLGEDENETTGTVVSVGQYARRGVPYPVERTKFILRKID